MQKLQVKLRCKSGVVEYRVRVVRISSNRRKRRSCYKKPCSGRGGDYQYCPAEGCWTYLEGAPVPSALEALCKAAHADVVRAASRWRGLDRDCSLAAVAGAFAVAAAQSKVLPLTEGAVATITCAVPFAVRMEACKLVEADLLGRVLPAEDAAAFPAVMAAVE
jgi:hypothetical protein